MIETKEQLREFLTANADKIRAFGVERIGVFGSFARGDQTPASDIDFMVVFQPGQKTWHHFSDLYDFLEEHAGRRVELLTPESLKERKRDRILAQVEYVPLAA